MPTNFDDLLEGDEGADLLQGLSGNDTLQGFSGNDLLYGGADNDSLLGDDGVDQLYGGSGLDTLYAGAGDDRVEGGSGDDQLYGEGGNDSLTGGDGNDTLIGDIGNDTIRGGFGDDLISDDIGGGFASIFGDSGNDRIILTSISLGMIDGGADDDFIDASRNTYARETQIFGGDGNDVVRTGSASVDCGTGDDAVIFAAMLPQHEAGWTGSYEGGDGYDRFLYSVNYDNYDQRSDIYLDWTRVTGFEEIVLRILEEASSWGGFIEAVNLSDANIGPSQNLLVRPGREEYAFEYWGDTPTFTLPSLITVNGSAVTTGHLTLTGC